MHARRTAALKALPSLAALLLVLTACPRATGADGVEDGGALPDVAAPDPEREIIDHPPPPPRSCLDDPDGCGEGLVCLPSALNPNLGVCRIDCAAYDDRGEIVGERPEACPADLACIRLVDPQSLTALEAVCLSPVTGRDRSCLAPLDEDACAEPYTCLLTHRSEEHQAAAFNCKQVCDVDADEPGCPPGESCLRPPEVSGSPWDPPSGVCGVSVPPLTFAQWSEGADASCNEVDDHRYCDDTLFEGLTRPGASLCLRPAREAFGFTGTCFARCSTPSVDIDADGALEAAEGELGETFQCPAGQGCTLDLGRALGVGVTVEDPDGPRGRKACEPTRCTSGAPCPAECGPGDAECIAVGDEHLCIAPVGSCEPLRDAGPPEDEVDAGPGTDAG